MSEERVTRHRWDEMPKERVNETIERRFIVGARVMSAQIFLERGTVVPLHSHENEQLTHMLEGVLRFRIGGAEPDEFEARAGEVVCIPGNVPHEAEALEDTVCLDIFSPPRQDWLDGTDDYFRRAPARR